MPVKSAATETNNSPVKISGPASNLDFFSELRGDIVALFNDAVFRSIKHNANRLVRGDIDQSDFTQIFPSAVHGVVHRQVMPAGQPVITSNGTEQIRLDGRRDLRKEGSTDSTS